MCESPIPHFNATKYFEMTIWDEIQTRQCFSDEDKHL